nr:reverse transcriptase domain-containing protein [Tanacetum cinerariifolium]
MLKSLLSNKEKLLELANTPLNKNCLAVILKKLPEKLGDPEKFLISCGFSEFKCKALADLGFTFPADFVIVDYESDPQVPLILERPFLRTARALIDVHGEEMILRDGDERLTLNMRHDTSSYSNQPHKESINMINIYNDSYEGYLEDLEIEYLLNHDPSKEMDFILEDSIDEYNLVDPNNDLVDIILEMFTDEHTPDYSSPPLYDDVDDDLC